MFSCRTKELYSEDLYVAESVCSLVLVRFSFEKKNVQLGSCLNRGKGEYKTLAWRQEWEEWWVEGEGRKEGSFSNK